MPLFCATKEEPQIAAVISSKILLRIFLLIRFISFLTKLYSILTKKAPSRKAQGAEFHEIFLFVWQSAFFFDTIDA